MSNTSDCHKCFILSAAVHFVGHMSGAGQVRLPVVLPWSSNLRKLPSEVALCALLCAGHDTKIFMNATQPPSKRSSIERSVDYIIFFMFALLFSMCITGCIYFAWWTATYMPQHWYLGPNNVVGAVEYDPRYPAIVGVTNFITSFILYGERSTTQRSTAQCRMAQRSTAKLAIVYVWRGGWIYIC